MIGNRLKSPAPWFILAITGVIIILIAFVWPPNISNSSEVQIELPEENRQMELVEDRLYLYASNEKLSKLLPGLDIYFKSQGLTGDHDSEEFKYSDDIGERKEIQNCVAFDYFHKRELVTTFTLIPKNPICFTQDKGTQDKIHALYNDFQQVYIIELY